MDYENVVIHFRNENENDTEEMITNRQSFCVSDDDCDMIQYCSEYVCDCKDGICNPVKKRPIDGGWSSWGTWSSCDSGTRTQKRDRICNNPPPQNGGLYCRNKSYEERACSGILEAIGKFINYLIAG